MRVPAGLEHRPAFSVKTIFMAITFFVPAGPKNMASLFPGVDFTQVDEYYLEINDTSDSSPDEGVLATTNHYNRACCCSDDTIQIFFVNSVGGIDMLIFRTDQIEAITQSTQWKKPLKYPLCKFDGGFQRMNVTSNRTYTAENFCFGESDQKYLEELLASPNAWMKLKAAQEQDDDYIPIVIADGDFIVQKPNDQQRHTYVMIIKFILGNDRQILRN